MKDTVDIAFNIVAQLAMLAVLVGGIVAVVIGWRYRPIGWLGIGLGVWAIVLGLLMSLMIIRFGWL